MKNRRLALAVIVLTLLLGFSSTVCAAGTQQQGEQGTTVRFLTFENDVVYDVIEMFEQEYPDIKISYDLPGSQEAEEPAQLRLGMGDPTLDIVTTEVGFEFQWFEKFFQGAVMLLCQHLGGSHQRGLVAVFHCAKRSDQGHHGLA